MSGWAQYITGMMVNKQLPSGAWLQNIVKEAAITTHDGTIAASTPGFQLGQYNYEVQVDEMTKKPVLVNEKQIFTEAVLNGKSNVSEAGIRINNAKYMLAKYDPEKKLAYLSKAKGGACMMATKSMIIFASYDTSMKMNDGREQLPALCNEVVEFVAKTLLASGS